MERWGFMSHRWIGTRPANAWQVETPGSPPTPPQAVWVWDDRRLAEEAEEKKNRKT